MNRTKVFLTIYCLLLSFVCLECAANSSDRVIINESAAAAAANIFNKTNETNSLIGLPLHTVIISTIFYTITLIVGLIGNALVIVVVGCNKSLQHNTNYCLVNLSVADLILIIVCMPSAIVSLEI